MVRRPDRVEIQIVGGTDSGAKVLRNFTSFSITNDITMPSEGAFELGDDGTYSGIDEFIAHGTEYKVFLNDKLRLTGRVEMQDIPLDPEGGPVVRFTVRTKLADAMYASADSYIKVKNTTIKDFILALYAPLGYTEDDFVFKANVARDLITGKDSSGQGTPTEVLLDKITAKDAKVNPGETVYAAADKHLRRYGYMHWDAPDGKIVVSAPNDKQDAIYNFRASRFGNTNLNNVMRLTRTQDWSGVPSTVTVWGRDEKGRIKGRVAPLEEENLDVYRAGFYRPVTIVNKSVRGLDRIQRVANRENTARSKQKDSWEVEIDGLSFWDGRELIPWAPDTVVNIESDVAGGALGAYYVHRTVINRDAVNGDTTNLSVLRKGIWVL